MTPRQKAAFFEQLSTLLSAGVPLNQSLLLAGKGYSSAFQRYLRQFSTAFGSSQDLTAIPVSPPYFDTWTLSLLQAAQSTGRLPETCQHLAKTLERSHRWRRLSIQIGFLAILSMGSLLGLGISLLPGDRSGPLLLSLWLLSLALLLGLSISSIAFFPTLRPLLHQFPPIRHSRSLQANLFLGELAFLLRSGIPLITALELLSRYIPDSEFAAHLKAATRQIRKGKTFSQSLVGKLTPTTLQTIRTGEETGHLDDLLETLAFHSQVELEKTFIQIQGLLFPTSILAVGGLIARIGITAIATLVNALPK